RQRNEKPKPPEPPEKEEPIAFRIEEQPPAKVKPERDLYAEMMAELPPEALPYKPLLMAKSGAIALDFANVSKAQWHFTFADEDAARDGEMSARVLLYVARELVPVLGREMHISRQSSPKFYAFLDELQVSLKEAKVERRGVDVTGSV